MWTSQWKSCIGHLTPLAVGFGTCVLLGAVEICRRKPRSKGGKARKQKTTHENLAKRRSRCGNCCCVVWSCLLRSPGTSRLHWIRRRSTLDATASELAPWRLASSFMPRIWATLLREVSWHQTQSHNSSSILGLRYDCGFQRLLSAGASETHCRLNSMVD